VTFLIILAAASQAAQQRLQAATAADIYCAVRLLFPFPSRVCFVL
jgi:hypothetical protein